MCAIAKGLSIHILSQNTNYVSHREAELPPGEKWWSTDMQVSDVYFPAKK